jgi:UDP-N-acetylglucosamine 2-epimerase (non-hydrolysing)
MGVPLKVLIVFGTRPEAIKLAPLIRELEAEPDRFQTRVCVTGQHRSLLDQVLATFEITPHHDLAVMEEDQDLLQVATRCLDRLTPVLKQERPDWILIQGDTTSGLAAALAAYYSRIRIGHVEAGLRTGDDQRPFPEEMNRRLTSCLADLHFAPTPHARENLLRAGVPEKRIHVTGNTGIDALAAIREKLAQRVVRIPGLEGLEGLEGFETRDGARPLVLVTGHRRESFGSGLRQICEALLAIARSCDVDVVYPVHLNPSVRGPVRSLLGDLPNVFLLDPLDYLSFVALMERSYLILTDSGGIQEEAPSLGKPVLVMRDVTERVEGLEAGTAMLVGTEAGNIVSQTVRLLTDPQEYERLRQTQNPYGDGKACARIARILAAEPRTNHKN